jgi:hypothetical protein
VVRSAPVGATSGFDKKVNLAQTDLPSISQLLSLKSDLKPLQNTRIK